MLKVLIKLKNFMLIEIEIFDIKKLYLFLMEEYYISKS